METRPLTWHPPGGAFLLALKSTPLAARCVKTGALRADSTFRPTCFPRRNPVPFQQEDRGYQGLQEAGPRHCLPGRYLTSDRTRSGSLLIRRQAAAMLVAPCRRCRLTARLRNVGISCGAGPVRAWEASWAKVTSRIQ